VLTFCRSTSRLAMTVTDASWWWWSTELRPLDVQNPAAVVAVVCIVSAITCHPHQTLQARSVTPSVMTIAARLNVTPEIYAYSGQFESI